MGIQSGSCKHLIELRFKLECALVNNEKYRSQSFLVDFVKNWFACHCKLHANYKKITKIYYFIYLLKDSSTTVLKEYKCVTVNSISKIYLQLNTSV